MVKPFDKKLVDSPRSSAPGRDKPSHSTDSRPPPAAEAPSSARRASERSASSDDTFVILYSGATCTAPLHLKLSPGDAKGSNNAIVSVPSDQDGPKASSCLLFRQRGTNEEDDGEHKRRSGNRVASSQDPKSLSVSSTFVRSRRRKDSHPKSQLVSCLRLTPPGTT
jgi:hypothetical protein